MDNQIIKQSIPFEFFYTHGALEFVDGDVMEFEDMLAMAIEQQGESPVWYLADGEEGGVPCLWITKRPLDKSIPDEGMLCTSIFLDNTPVAVH
jgi:hypothetical protein